MTALIIGGWILLIGSTTGGITVVPTQYASKDACEAAAKEVEAGLPANVGWRCLKAGEGYR